MGRLIFSIFGDLKFRELQQSDFPTLSVFLFISFTLTFTMLLLSFLLQAFSEGWYTRLLSEQRRQWLLLRASYLLQVHVCREDCPPLKHFFFFCLSYLPIFCIVFQAEHSWIGHGLRHLQLRMYSSSHTFGYMCSETLRPVAFCDTSYPPKKHLLDALRTVRTVYLLTMVGDDHMVVEPVIDSAMGSSPLSKPNIEGCRSIGCTSSAKASTSTVVSSCKSLDSFERLQWIDALNTAMAQTELQEHIYPHQPSSAFKPLSAPHHPHESLFAPASNALHFAATIFLIATLWNCCPLQFDESDRQTEVLLHELRSLFGASQPEQSSYGMRWGPIDEPQRPEEGSHVSLVRGASVGQILTAHLEADDIDDDMGRVQVGGSCKGELQGAVRTALGRTPTKSLRQRVDRSRSGRQDLRHSNAQFSPAGAQTTGNWTGMKQHITGLVSERVHLAPISQLLSVLSDDKMRSTPLGGSPRRALQLCADERKASRVRV